VGDTSFDRRQYERVPVSLAVEVRDARGFSLHSSRDLSIGGVFFEFAIPHPVGERVELTFSLPGDHQPISCRGEVVNVPDATAFGMGIQFVDLRPADLTRLEAFVVRELNGGTG